MAPEVRAGMKHGRRAKVRELQPHRGRKASHTVGPNEHWKEQTTWGVRLRTRWTTACYHAPLPPRATASSSARRRAPSAQSHWVAWWGYKNATLAPPVSAARNVTAAINVGPGRRDAEAIGANCGGRIRSVTDAASGSPSESSATCATRAVEPTAGGATASSMKRLALSSSGPSLNLPEGCGGRGFWRNGGQSGRRRPLG